MVLAENAFCSVDLHFLKFLICKLFLNLNFTVETVSCIKPTNIAEKNEAFRSTRGEPLCLYLRHGYHSLHFDK